MFLVVAGLAITGCSTPRSLHITALKFVPRWHQNAPATDSYIYWSGNPRFPVKVLTEFRSGCNIPGFTCDTKRRTVTSAANPLVWARTNGCIGNMNKASPPWTSSLGVWLMDADGIASEKIVVTQTCVYSDMQPVAAELVNFSTVPGLTATLRSPVEIPIDPVSIGRSAVLAAAMIFLVAFPAQLFNSTLQAHYEEVIGWFAGPARFVRRRRRPVAEAVPAAGRRTPRPLLGGVILLGAVLAAMLDPGFGANLGTAESVVGSLLAVALSTLVFTGVNAVALHRATGRWGYFRVFFGGVVVAAACVAVSRLTGAQPGYMYGILWAYALAPGVRPPREREGAVVAVGAASMLAFSVLVWLLWAPVKAAVMGSPTGPLVVLSQAMAGIFVGGLTAVQFGLFPMRFLDGEKLLAWQRLLWLALFGLATFCFVHVVLNTAASAPHPGRQYVVTIGLFVAFGTLSTGFWAYFRYRPRRSAHQVVVAGP